MAAPLLNAGCDLEGRFAVGRRKDRSHGRIRIDTRIEFTGMVELKNRHGVGARPTRIIELHLFASTERFGHKHQDGPALMDLAVAGLLERVARQLGLALIPVAIPLGG